MKQKILALLLAMCMLFSLCLTGCQGGEKANDSDKSGGSSSSEEKDNKDDGNQASSGEGTEAEQVAVAIFNLILKNDASDAVKVFGYASEEEALADMGLEGGIYQMLADEMVAQFQSESIPVSDEVAHQFADAFLSMFQKVDFSAKVKECDEKAGTAVVTCTISTYDSNFLNDALEQATEIVSEDEELMNSQDETELYNRLLLELINILKDASPSGETADFDVDFEKTNMEVNGKLKKIWVPVDSEEFGNLISTTALGV